MSAQHQDVHCWDITPQSYRATLSSTICCVRACARALVYIFSPVVDYVYMYQEGESCLLNPSSHCHHNPSRSLDLMTCTYVRHSRRSYSSSTSPIRIACHHPPSPTNLTPSYCPAVFWPGVGSLNKKQCVSRRWSCNSHLRTGTSSAFARTTAGTRANR